MVVGSGVGGVVVVDVGVFVFCRYRCWCGSGYDVGDGVRGVVVLLVVMVVFSFCG